MEDRISTDWSHYRITFLLQFFHRRNDFPYLLVSKKSMLAAVRIQAGYCHGSLTHSQLFQSLEATLYIILDSLLRDHIQHLP